MNSNLSSPEKSPAQPKRILAIMPHPDDMEFLIGGTLALLHEKYGEGVKIRVVTTDTGASGHHIMSPEETALVRRVEAERAAAIIGAEFDFLRRLDGGFFQSPVFANRETTGAVWDEVRRFQPDVIFSPPPVVDPLAGIHVDHEGTAQAVRSAAFLLGVPHAFADGSTFGVKGYTPPLIILTHDFYSKEGGFHIANDIRSVLETKIAMLECHHSQLVEWLPYVSQKPSKGVRGDLLDRHEAMNLAHNLPAGSLVEVFQISAWGRKPRPGEIEWLFPDALSNI
jgi:LmbE family N-acetylglucosaminyl deacetylase